MMKRGQLGRVFDLEAAKQSEGDVPVPQDSLRVPTVNERAILYLHAVYGPRDFTSEEIAEARNRILDAMAADITTRSGMSLEDTLDGDIIDTDRPQPYYPYA